MVGLRPVHRYKQKRRAGVSRSERQQQKGIFEYFFHYVRNIINAGSRKEIF
jgi:hypothetical protein